MKNIQLFNVVPTVPEKLAFLQTLSRNLWWSWNPNAAELFRRIDPIGWEDSGHNPIKFLATITQEDMNALADDEGFMNHLESVRMEYEKEVAEVARSNESCRDQRCIAYFSLEYGLHESLRIYSGGLGVLAGDHLKSSSDMKLPMVAVGLYYEKGYFEQQLDKDGWQQESNPSLELHNLPLRRVTDEHNQPVEITVPMPGHVLYANIYRINVGSIPLLLLDTNLPKNPPELRSITSRLYIGDRAMRLRQELLLGIGGVRALVAIGYEPGVFHINEGHAAFMNLARIEFLVKQRGLGREEAIELLRRTNVFTTHTPVPAGNETFEADMLLPYLEAVVTDMDTGITAEDVISWGRSTAADDGEDFCMTVLGLRMAKYNNGVSELHGKVERGMWQHLWPHVPRDEVPIGHITNGVHAPSWVSDEFAEIFDQYLGSTWRYKPVDEEVLEKIDDIPDEALWRAHEGLRSNLIRSARRCMERQLRGRSATNAEMAQAKSVLNHDALTVGFARRFATYKRAALLLREEGRLVELLKDEDRPVQFIFAGKAHPADEGGKNLIKQLVQFSRRPEARHHVIFLENYDISIARLMVQGADVWLNNPRRPHEASGTSGMKAAMNGVLHASTLDGWWCEAYDGEAGWAIGDQREYEDWEYQDSVEVQALYNLLENDVIPRFFQRSENNIPASWVAMMKQSIRMGLGDYSSHRMVDRYRERYYDRALDAYRDLSADRGVRAAEAVARRARIAELWPGVSIGIPEADRNIGNLSAGESFSVSAAVKLGQLSPEEIDVQVYYGPVGPKNEILESRTVNMVPGEKRKDNTCVYRGEVGCENLGHFGFTARVVPRDPDIRMAIPGFIKWSE